MHYFNFSLIFGWHHYLPKDYDFSSFNYYSKLLSSISIPITSNKGNLSLPLNFLVNPNLEFTI